MLIRDAWNKIRNRRRHLCRGEKPVSNEEGDDAELVATYIIITTTKQFPIGRAASLSSQAFWLKWPLGRTAEGESENKSNKELLFSRQGLTILASVFGIDRINTANSSFSRGKLAAVHALEPVGFAVLCSPQENTTHGSRLLGL